jgi:hypothetical protein
MESPAYPPARSIGHATRVQHQPCAFQSSGPDWLAESRSTDPPPSPSVYPSTSLPFSEERVSVGNIVMSVVSRSKRHDTVTAVSIVSILEGGDATVVATSSMDNNPANCFPADGSRGATQRRELRVSGTTAAHQHHVGCRILNRVWPLSGNVNDGTRPHTAGLCGLLERAAVSPRHHRRRLVKEYQNESVSYLSSFHDWRPRRIPTGVIHCGGLDFELKM